MMKRIVTIAALALVALTAGAEIRLPSVIGDNMVLQRESHARIWGWAGPGATVKVKTSWDGASYRVKAGQDGRWEVMVSTGAAGGPYTISLSDGRETRLTGIMLGEVWICSGQSNMEMPVQGFLGQPCLHAAETMREARQYPDIRLFTVGRKTSDTPVEDCQGQWLLPDPATVGAFSAVAYYFGRCLNQYLGVPVGLIASDWGGTNIEAWMSEGSVSALGIDKEYCDKNWNEDYTPCSVLYNGMIAPVIPFTAKGFIWYQGESNRHNWYDYAEMQVEMIRQWREAWGDDEMPFYLTQIAPYRYDGPEKRRSAMLVEQQCKAVSAIGHCGMASTTDVGHPSLIHEPDKLSVGERLAWLALSRDYAVPGVPADAPTYKSMEVKDGKVVVSFNNVCAPDDQTDPRSFTWCADDGSIVRQVKGFEIAGEDKVFHKANARLLWSQNQVEVWSEGVPEPVAVRYSFCNYVETNLKTTIGQPVIPFRSDDWEIPASEL